MIKQCRSMPTHGHYVAATTELGDKISPTIGYQKTLHTSAQTLGDIQTTHVPQPTTFYNIIKSSTEDLETPLKSDLESSTNSEGISTVKHISEKYSLMDDKNHYTKDVIGRSIVPTLQSDVKDATPTHITHDSFTTQDLKQSSSNEYPNREPTESQNGSKFAKTQYTTEIVNRVTTLKDATRATDRETSKLETTEKADFMVSGILLNSVDKDDINLSGNRATSEQKDRRSTTRASRSVRNRVMPNTIGLSGNESLENLHPTRTVLDATTRHIESYTIDENRLNSTISMATNLEWCTNSVYDSLYQTNNITITEFASLSNNQEISQSSIDGLMLCQSITVIRASLRLVNNSLYTYEPLLQQYIGRGHSQVITFYNSLRKNVQKLVNPSSKGPVMIQNSGSYVHDTSRTLETLATLNRLSGQIRDVLKQIRQCNTILKNSA